MSTVEEMRNFRRPPSVEREIACRWADVLEAAEKRIAVLTDALERYADRSAWSHDDEWCFGRKENDATQIALDALGMTQEELQAKFSAELREDLEDEKRGFCRHCGARIPHLDGEGRCGRCWHHAAKEKP